MLPPAWPPAWLWPAHPSPPLPSILAGRGEGGRPHPGQPLRPLSGLVGRRLPWGGSLSGARGVQTCPFSRRVGGLPGALPRALQQGIEAAGAMPTGGVHPFPAAWSPPDHCSPVSLTWGHQLGTCHARAYFYTLNPRKDLKWTRKQDGRDGASTLRPHSWAHLPPDGSHTPPLPASGPRRPSLRPPTCPGTEAAS